MRIIFIIFWFGLLAILMSCNSEINQKQIDNITTESDIKYAEFFKIKNTDSNIILIIINPWKPNEILQKYRFSLNNNSNIQSDISLPVNRLSIHSLDNIGFVSELGKLNSVCAITDENRLYNPQIINQINQGITVDLGPAVDINLERLLMSKPDLILSTTYESSDNSQSIINKAGIPIIYNLGWMESSPLGRAEWIKVIGLILGKTAEADSVFEQIEKSYLELKSLTQDIENKPKVMIGAGYNGTWYMPGGQSFKSILMRDAGADYHWFSNQSKGSLAYSFETVLTYHLNDDIWIEAPWYDYNEMKLADSRYLNFNSVIQKQVFNNFGRAKGLANDYWETGICRPDYILMDLIEIFHPQLIDHQLIYYKSL